MNIAGVRPRALLAGLVSATLIGTLLPVPQAAAEPQSRHLAPQMDRPDNHGNEVTAGTAWAQRGQPQVVTPEPVWPSGTGQATLPPAIASASSAGMAAIAADVAATPVRAGSLPVWVRRAAGQAGERLTGVTVQALDRAKVPVAWRDGMLLRLTGDGFTGEGEAVVSVDYDGFRYAYGAEWASRLRLWRVPECALTTPGRAGCGAVAVPSTNDVPAGKVTGHLPIASAGGTLLAVTAGTAGSGGDFAATSLSPSSTWSVGGSSGDFSWSYGMRVPPAMGGPQPSLSLSYSSSSVDGRSEATNNQPSWIGEGFEYSPGYIERRYVPCAEDMEGDDHNNQIKTGDMCWRSDNAVMSLSGRSTELVFQQGKGWHARNEDGSKIEKLFALGNGDNDGEYWKVTDTAGVQYFFGRHSLPGQTDVTNSTATVRVYGNNPNDKCYLAQFNLAHCDQAWRWNLDYVIDPRGNTMSLWYDKEFNKYAANATETEEVSYVRATALRRIDYGTWDRGATDRSVTARAQVFFDPGDRCLSSCGTHDADHWPDVPWDLECTGDECEGNFTPSFWTMPCGQNPASEDDIISDMRLSYDGASSPDTVPAYGSVSKTEQLKSWTAAGGTVFQTVGQATYDAFGRAASSTDRRGNTTNLTYIPANAPVASARSLTGSPYNWETITEIAPYWGTVKKITDPNDRVSEAQFDAAGRVWKVWDAGWTEDEHPTQPTTEYTYNFAPGRNAYPYVTTKTLHAAGGYRTSYQIYDGLLRSRQTQTAAAAGGGRVVTDTVYDKLGRPATSYAKHVEPGTASGALWYEPEWSVPAVAKTLYDNASRPKAKVFYGSDGVTNLVEKWRTTTMYLGDQVAVTPPDGGVPTTTVSDAHGRMTELRQHTTAAGVDGAYDTTRYVYNRKSQLTKVIDPALNEWTYAYDIKGRLFQTNDPDRGRTTNTFTDHDDLDTTTDARGEVIAYGYDQLGRKTGSYDDVVSAATKRTEWKYDQLYTGATARGQLTEAIRYDPPGSANAYKWQVRQFTERYQPSGVNYVIPGNEAGISGTWVIGQNYSQYDGSPTEVVYPEGGGLAVETVTTAYDTVTGLPSTLNTNLPGTSSYVALQQYTPFGEPTLTMRKIGGGVYVEDATYYDEATRRVTKTSVLPETATGTVTDRSYKYLPAGTITEISDTPAVGMADTQCFGHDRLARLTSAWTPKTGVACATAPSVGNLGGPAPYWLDWTFDKTGNRLTEVSHTTAGDTNRRFAVPNGGTGVVRPHAVTAVTTTPPSGPAVTRGFSYDNTGNTTARTGPGGAAQTLAWDAEGRLSTVTENGTRVAGNTYDADGTRLVRRDTTGTTLYLPGMEIRKPVGLGTATATRYYSFGGRLIASRTPGAQALTWLYTDHQGTQQTAVNAYTQQVANRRQTPYGEPRGSQPTWPNERGFVGGDSEPTGLVHIGARQYDSALGRFISVDPLMDLTDPQQWNGYAYGNNTPVTLSDPTGLCLTANGGVSAQGDECGGREIPTVTPPPPSSSDEGNDDEPKGSTTTMPNGTVLYEENGRTYINGFDVTEALRLKGAPSALDFARGIDRYVGENPGLAWMLYDGEGLGFLISHAFKYYGVKTGSHFHIWAKFSADPIMSDPLTWGSLGPAGMGSGGIRGGRRPGGGTRGYGPGCGGSSFVPGTQVLMDDGTTRPIEEVAAGDAVVATDPLTGKTEVRTVTATITSEGEKDLVTITVDTDGTDGGATATVTATDEHPFWLPNLEEWVAAIDLRSGGWLQTSAGTWVQITAVTQWRQPFRVHNLTVDRIHTYYVLAGNAPVLVHNCPREAPSAADRAAARKLRLPVDSPAVVNRDMRVEDYIARYRKASVKGELGGEYMQMTVEEALRTGDTKVRKLLIDGRFAK